MTGYWTLEESYGDQLYDTSIYGTVQSFPNKLQWQYDPTLKANLLYSKPHQSFEEVEGYMIPKGITCLSPCLYCSTYRYCKSCITGTFLHSGDCLTFHADSVAHTFHTDTREREYEPLPKTLPCADHKCQECSQYNPSTCTKCINGATLKGNACFYGCEPGNFLSGTNCVPCPARCVKCSSSTTCDLCDYGYYIENNACVGPICGDGVVTAEAEECDDGNTVDGDGCSSQCTLESEDFVCTVVGGSRTVCTPLCGDGKFYGTNGEECDDGNVESGDGCSSVCKIEDGWWCSSTTKAGISQCYCSPKQVGVGAFSENYMKLSFKFSKPLLKYAGSLDACEYLFGDTVRSFGENPSCEIEGDTVAVSLGKGNTVYGETPIVTAKGVVKAEGCEKNYELAESLEVEAIPGQEVDAEIDVKNIVNSCEDFTIKVYNVKGTLNRPLIELAVRVDSIVSTGTSGHDSNAVSTNMQEVDTKLSKVAGSDPYQMEIPALAVLSYARYTLRATVTNFQGRSKTLSATFEVLDDASLSFSLEGASEKSVTYVRRSENVVVRVRPEFESCLKVPYSFSDVVTSYTIVSAPQGYALALVPKANRLLHIPARTLQVGVQYRFKVECSIATLLGEPLDVPLSLSKEFAIEAVESELKVSVSPATQIISQGKNFTISAAKTHHRTFVV